MKVNPDRFVLPDDDLAKAATIGQNMCIQWNIYTLRQSEVTSKGIAGRRHRNKVREELKREAV
jgi:hypothetical protein